MEHRWGRFEQVGGQRRTAPSTRFATTGLLVAVVGLLVSLVLAPTAAAATPEWNVARVGAPMGAPGIVVAVVDTGVDAAHPTFGGRVLPAIDLVGGSGGDPHGHGTHVAGTVGGGSAGPGIGVARDVRILPVRVLGADGSGNGRDVAEGIVRAADAGAHVINLSLGADVVIRNVFGSGFEEAIRYAWAKGSIVVLAAGNDRLVGSLLGSGYGNLPAVVVTATTAEDRSPGYATSIGSARWGIAAPGGDASGRAGHDVLSALPGDRYGLKAGTSMAAPHAAGALAVLRSQGLSPAAAIDRLLATARPLGARATFGAGLVDLEAATAGLRAAPASAAGPAAASPAPPTPAPPAPPPTTAAPATAAPNTVPPTSSPTTTTAPSTDAPTTAAPTTEPSTTTSAPGDAVREAAAPPSPPGGTGGDPARLVAGAAGLATCVAAWAASIGVARRRRTPA